MHKNTTICHRRSGGHKSSIGISLFLFILLYSSQSQAEDSVYASIGHNQSTNLPIIINFSKTNLSDGSIWKHFNKSTLSAQLIMPDHTSLNIAILIEQQDWGNYKDIEPSKLSNQRYLYGILTKLTPDLSRKYLCFHENDFLFEKGAYKLIIKTDAMKTEILFIVSDSEINFKEVDKNISDDRIGLFLKNKLLFKKDIPLLIYDLFNSPSKDANDSVKKLLWLSYLDPIYIDDIYESLLFRIANFNDDSKCISLKNHIYDILCRYLRENKDNPKYSQVIINIFKSMLYIPDCKISFYSAYALAGINKIDGMNILVNNIIAKDSIYRNEASEALNRIKEMPDVKKYLKDIYQKQKNEMDDFAKDILEKLIE